jgi:hypothetical protein
MVVPSGLFLGIFLDILGIFLESIPWSITYQHVVFALRLLALFSPWFEDVTDFGADAQERTQNGATANRRVRRE